MGKLSRASIVAAVLSTASVAVAQPDPSYTFLTTGNGFGFQVFDRDQNAVTRYLEHPYRFLREHPVFPDGDGVVRRDLAFDTYFGIQTAGESVWLAKREPKEVGYLEQSNIIRSVVDIGKLKTESHFFAPYGISQNVMVMVLVVENTGSDPEKVTAFSVHNFKMGSAANPDEPAGNGETVNFTSGYAKESGPGGGVLVYAPVGGVDVASCDAGAWGAVQSGSMPASAHNCSGSDRVQVFAKDLGTIAPGERKSFAVAVLYSETTSEAGLLTAWNEFRGEKSGQELIDATLAEWEAWRMPQPKLQGDELRIWRQSEVVLRMGQVLEPYSEANPKRKNHGMILASLPPGGWHTGWVRDGVYAIVALARTGHWEEAKKGLNFFLDADAGRFSSYLNGVDYRISTVRYFGDGQEEADFSGQPTRNVEIDGWGLFLWAARIYLDASGDTAWLNERTKKGDTVYEAMQRGIAEPLAQSLEPEGMAIADASIWEVHWGNREHFAYTSATTARGFCDMGAIARRLDRTPDQERYAGLATTVSTALKTHFIDQRRVLAGSVEKLARGTNYHDGAVVEAFNWNVIEPTDPIAAATMGAFSVLQTQVGGYKRIEGSADQYDSDEWIFIDLRAADVFRALGQSEKANALLNSITSAAAVNNDQIPELYNTNPFAGTIGRYTGSIPMVGYGAGIYMTSILARAGFGERSDCGTEAPPPAPVGPPNYDDVVPVGPGGTTSGPDEYTGFACLCQAGAPPHAPTLLLLALCWALAWRRRRV